MFAAHCDTGVLICSPSDLRGPLWATVLFGGGKKIYGKMQFGDPDAKCPHCTLVLTGGKKSSAVNTLYEHCRICHPKKEMPVFRRVTVLLKSAKGAKDEEKLWHCKHCDTVITRHPELREEVTNDGLQRAVAHKRRQHKQEKHAQMSFKHHLPDALVRVWLESEDWRVCSRHHRACLQCSHGHLSIKLCNSFAVAHTRQGLPDS